jgi:hypothetical protein
MMTRKQGSMNFQILSGKPAQSQGFKVHTGLSLGATDLKTACVICKSNCDINYNLTLQDGPVDEQDLFECMQGCGLVCTD